MDPGIEKKRFPPEPKKRGRDLWAGPPTGGFGIVGGSHTGTIVALVVAVDCILHPAFISLCFPMYRKQRDTHLF